MAEQTLGFLYGSFNRTSFHLLEACFAGEVTIVQSLTDGALTQTLEAAQSVPWQAFSGLTLVLAVLLMFLGWYLVRAVNFCGGLYIGASVSVFLLSFAAGTPLMHNCHAMISVVVGSALLVAIICIIYRKSMYLVLGMISGEIIGKFFYHLTWESYGFGSNTLYMSIGFFAILGAYAVKEVGDLAWMICTALMGAYFATTALVELVVVRYVPDGYNYAAFLAYRPSPDLSGLHKDVQNFVVSKYLWAPLGTMLLLTLIGLLTQLACYNQMMRKRKRAEVSLIQI
eukprot:CAMPEP_0119057876 /NCGR_PEP_ID=MMETSP1178-20130426/2266_1 /TAXON_ID=33656 /ORGANISM="unid sp, Strain CCMP2000" /LENGTH=283 /DNA_ID=CAMNT_0007038743 /DNA_START=53 /DNA_END=904 /DNA_ORIENTATION=-